MKLKKRIRKVIENHIVMTRDKTKAFARAIEEEIAGHSVDFSHRLANENPDWQDDIDFYDCMTMPLSNALAMIDAEGDGKSTLMWAAEKEIREARQILDIWLKNRPVSERGAS